MAQSMISVADSALLGVSRGPGGAVCVVAALDRA